MEQQSYHACERTKLKEKHNQARHTQTDHMFYYSI